MITDYELGQTTENPLGGFNSVPASHPSNPLDVLRTDPSFNPVIAGYAATALEYELNSYTGANGVEEYEVPRLKIYGSFKELITLMTEIPQIIVCDKLLYFIEEQLLEIEANY